MYNESGKEHKFYKWHKSTNVNNWCQQAVLCMEYV
jgi:hypothetical protein